jgi:acetoacetyl-CoA synthetase
MGEPLWRPSPAVKSQSNMARFIEFVNEKFRLRVDSYAALHAWSVERVADFWASVAEFVGIKFSAPYAAVVEDLDVFPGTRWFPGARLNFAENLLRYRDDRPALVAHDESGKTAELTYAALYNAVARLARAFRASGVKPGDRVVGYMPNIPEAAIGMLAAAAIGATWASCATDFGPAAVLDRLGQVQPKVLLTVNGYHYKGKAYDIIANVAKIARDTPSLEKVVLVENLAETADVAGVPHAVLYRDFVAGEADPPLEFEPTPFGHPLYIMFSSGTTGRPKCLVQSAGGILINHLKELAIHSDLRRDDRIFYITSCSWMMWNWLLSALGVGATIVLYDGNPLHPDDGAMWQLVQDEQVTIFGLSASYLNVVRKAGAEPGKTHDLSRLRQISQTGSPLSADGFEWVYRAVKADLHFNSIAGGTDINGCFAIGSPYQPVYAGQLQGPGLGMKINACNAAGEAVVDQEAELVCELPAPSMPIRFWDDPQNEKYLAAYFHYYPNRNVWRHGDFVIFHSDTGGISFHGRSDAVLKPSGARIGTAEIYTVIDQIPEVLDALAVGQDVAGDQRALLFVKLAPGVELTPALVGTIKRRLREERTPRHVPALVLAVPDIPYTMNGKKSEAPIANIVNGRPVTNSAALVNPECLAFYERILPQLQAVAPERS